MADGPGKGPLSPVQGLTSLVRSSVFTLGAEGKALKSFTQIKIKI